jgi:hypothetical protein
VNKLQAALEKSLDEKDPEKREAAFQKAIDDHDELKLKDLEANTTPGYETKAVLNKELGVTEHIQVPSHNPKDVDVAEEAKASGATIPAAGTTPAPAAPKGE